MQANISITGSTYSATGVSAVPKAGAFLGFGNMLKKEMRDWFATKRWLVVGGISTGIVLALQLVAYLATKDLSAADMEKVQNTPPPLQMPIMLLGTLLVVATIIVTQGEVVEEKKSGTAAWIMSKPASRVSFILSKWIASTFSVLLLTLVVPGVVGVAVGALLTGQSFNFGNYAIAFGFLALYYAVFVSLGIFFGTFMPVERAVSAGGSGLFIAMALFGQDFPPSVVAYFPSSLATLAQSAVTTGAIPTLAPVISSVIIIVGSVIGACYIFGKQEL